MKQLICFALVLCLLTGSALAYVETTGNVNLRKGPGLAYDIVETVNEGTRLDDLGKTRQDDRGVDWLWVWHDGMDCWVSSKYAKVVEEPAEYAFAGAAAPLANTRWVATWEEHIPMGEKPKKTELPDEYSGYELLLFEDGRAQLQRINPNDGSLLEDPNGYWQVVDDALIVSKHRDPSDDDPWNVQSFELSEGVLAWKVYEGYTIYLEPALMTQAWQPVPVERLVGSWNMVLGYVDGWEYTAEGDGIQSTLTFYYDKKNKLRADYVSSDFYPDGKKGLEILKYVEGDGDFISGWGPWYVMIDIQDGTEKRIFMKDDDTLQVESRFMQDGYPAMSYRVYKREGTAEQRADDVRYGAARLGSRRFGEDSFLIEIVEYLWITPEDADRIREYNLAPDLDGCDYEIVRKEDASRFYAISKEDARFEILSGEYMTELRPADWLDFEARMDEQGGSDDPESWMFVEFCVEQANQGPDCIVSIREQYVP